MIKPIVSRIKKPVEFPIEVSNAKTRQTHEEIPIPSNDNGFLFVLLIIISATIYPAISLPPMISWFTSILNPALLKLRDVK